MPSHSTNAIRRARPLLGTLVEISVSGMDDEASAAIETAFAAIEDVHRLMSFHDPASDVSRINAADSGCAVVVDARTHEVLAAAKRLGKLSNGAFDITIAPALVRNGFLPAPPSPQAPADDAGLDDLELLDGQHVRWRRKGWIDLGGIAKGYAVDRAIDALRAHGISDAVVNAGGDLRCIGAAQPIHVRHPDAPAQMAMLGWLRDAAIATSAGYHAGIERDGRRIDPLVDPADCGCITWEHSISVVADDAMTADALTKIVRLAPAAAPELLSNSDAQAVIIDGDRMGICGAVKLLQEKPE